MEELQIKVSNTLGVITTNFEEIEANLKAVAADYKGIVVTEDTVKESKKDVAQLRKIIKEIEDSRKSVKKQWNAPYAQFEDRCKQLEAVIESPINEIQSQIEVFEQKKIAEKKEHLASLYSENIEDFSDYIPFDVTLGDKWQNVSYTDKDYLYDLSEKKVKIKTDLATISSLHSEIEEEVIATYKNSGNILSVAIQMNSDYLSVKSMAEKKIAEERQLEVNPIAPTACQPSEPVDVWADVDTETGEIIQTFTFKVQGNEYIEKVKDFLNFAEIPYIEV